jgi:hypothetical protein
MDDNEHCGLFAEYNAITLLQLFNISSDMGSDSNDPATNDTPDDDDGTIKSLRNVINAILAKVVISASSGIGTPTNGVVTSFAVFLVTSSIDDNERYQYLDV